MSALCAAVFGVFGYVGFQCVMNNSESDLFLANVEALSSLEFSDDDECWGPAQYSTVTSKKGYTTGRVHMADSIDIETVYHYLSCTADGEGHLRGANYLEILDTEDSYVKCTDNHIYPQLYN